MMMGRDHALDQIRGLSVLGILMVNAIGFGMPLSVYSNPGLSPLPFSPSDLSAWWVTEVFFKEKFIFLFNMLFGVSLSLVAKDLTTATTKAVWRRLLFLLAAGLIHGALIWDGDILLLYAIVGMVFFTCLTWKPSRLIWVGLSLIGVGFCLLTLPILVAIAQSDFALPSPEAITARIAEMRGTFAQSTASNFAAWVPQAIGMVIVYFPTALGTMMLGLGLYRIGLFDPNRAKTVRIALMAAGALALLVIGYQAHLSLKAQFPPLDMIGKNAMANRALAPLVALMYASLIVMLPQMLRALEPVGRMAFSLYIGQSLIMTGLFFGGHWLKDPLYGTLNYGGMVPIVLCVWVFCILFAHLWLRFFRYGPLEWLWRSATHARWVSIR